MLLTTAFNQKKACPLTIGHAFLFICKSLFSGGSLFCSRSFCLSGSSSFSLSGGLSLSSSLTLGSNSICFGFVEFLLCIETLFLYRTHLVFGFALDVSNLVLLGLEPLVELHVSLFLTDSAFLNTNLKVTFEQDTLVGKDAAAGVARLSAVLKPLSSSVNIEDDGGRVGQRIVGA